MTNRLKKTARSIVVPEQAARAAIPYRPAQPSYYSVETNIECSTITTLVGARPPAVVSFADYATDPPSIGYRLDPGDPGTYIFTTDCKPVTRVVFHPAVPEQKAQAAVDYRPQTVVQEFGLGWNAGARSIAELPGNGAATFKITSAVQAQTEAVRAAALTNESRSRQYESTVRAYSAVVSAKGEVARTRLENERQKIIAFQAKTQAAVSYATLAQTYYKTKADVQVSYADMKLRAQLGQITSMTSFQGTIANLANQSAGIYGQLASTAMSGMNSLVVAEQS